MGFLGGLCIGLIVALDCIFSVAKDTADRVGRLWKRFSRKAEVRRDE